MSKTPKTDALRLKMAQLGWPPDAEPVSTIMSSHSELERELDFSEQSGRQIWSANKRLQSDLVAERALADRLATALKQSNEGFGDRLPCEESCECAGRRIMKSNEEALAAWKEARNDP